MAASYTTLQSVKDSYLGDWQDDWDSWVERNIPIVSSILRQLFKSYSRNIDNDLATGEAEEILVEEVANNMITRRVSASHEGLATAGGSPFTNLSESVGAISGSITVANDEGSFYIKKSERRMLGLAGVYMVAMTFSLLDQEDFHVTIHP